MASIFALLVLFLGVGVLAGSFNGRVRLILVVGIIGYLVYLYVA